MSATHHANRTAPKGRAANEWQCASHRLTK